MAPGITDFTNPFFKLTNGASAIASAGNEEQKTQATTQFIETAIDSIFTIAKKAADAEQETTENAEQAQELDNNAEEIRTRTYARAQETISRIEQNAARVEGLLANLQASSDKIQEHKKQLEEQKGIIETNKTILNNPEASKDERKTALENIKKAGIAITELETTIQEYSQVTEDLGNELDKTTKENQDLTVEGEEIVNQGTAEIKDVTTDASGELSQKVTQSTIKGAKNSSVGASEIAVGTPMLSNLATAAEGQRLIRSGEDNIKAGGIRTAKSAITMGDVMGTIREGFATIGQIGNYANTMSDGNLNTYNLIGQFNTDFDGFIRTIGSWTNIEGVGNEFAQKAEEKIAKLDETNTKKEGEEETDTQGKSSTLSGDNFDTKKLELEVEKA